MLDRADELAARDNYHGEATWRRIIDALGQLVTKTLPGALIDDRKFVPQIRPPACPLVSFLITDFSRTERQGRTHASAQTHSEDTGTRSSLARMAFADWVQTNGFG
jgi:hypothetical protein